MRIALLIVGIIAVLIGLLWIGQGSGVVPWPQSSFMINQKPWMWWGALLAVIGIAVIVLSQRV